MLEKASYQNHTIYHHTTRLKTNNNLIVLRDIHITKPTLSFKKIPCAWAKPLSVHSSMVLQSTQRGCEQLLCNLDRAESCTTATWEGT